MSGDNAYFQTKRISLSKDKYEKAQEMFEKVKKFIKKNYFEDEVIPWHRGDKNYETLYNLINMAIQYGILGCNEYGLQDLTVGYFGEAEVDFLDDDSIATGILYAALLTAVEKDNIEIFIDFFASDPNRTEVNIDEDRYYISVCGRTCIELCFGEDECFEGEKEIITEE